MQTHTRSFLALSCAFTLATLGSASAQFRSPTATPSPTPTATPLTTPGIGAPGIGSSPAISPPPGLSPTVRPMTETSENNDSTATSSENNSSTTAATNPNQTRPALVLGTKLVGTSVRNEQDENLGRISNIVVNPETGHIRYAVIDTNGRKVTVPWNALREAPHAATDEAPHFVLNTTKEKLANAPAFNPNAMSNLSNRTAEEPIFTYFDIVWFPDVLSPSEEHAHNGQTASSFNENPSPSPGE